MSEMGKALSLATSVDACASGGKAMAAGIYTYQIKCDQHIIETGKLVIIH